MADNLTEYALPGVLAEIARLTSVETAIGVARRVGGRDIYVPHKLPREHQLVTLLGRKCALIICERHGGSHLEFPSAKPALRWHDARKMRRQGKSIAEIAARLGIGKRRVEQLTEGMAVPDPSQLETISEIRVSACPACGRKNCGPKRSRHSDIRQGDLFSAPQSFGTD